MTSAPGIASAVASAALRSANSPKQVGPEPLTRATSAHGGQLGPQGERDGLEVVVDGGLPAGRVGVDGGANGLDVELLAPTLRAVELGIDVHGREALGLGNQHRGERRQRDRLDELAGAGHERVTRLDLARHV